MPKSWARWLPDKPGWLSYKTGAYRQSLQFYEQAAHISGGEAWALYGMMNCLTELGDQGTISRVATALYAEEEAAVQTC